ncbi:hypothetical protein BVRB_2g039840 isoform B [Beta vulgaris subsp. vulgaris]|nr:hypothetical protein BVRB_2g039840 isoform B [Beta vulgaris subsp. vulgaris]
MYETYTTWDLHGEKINKSSSDSMANMENRDEIHSDDSGVNMLEDAFGVPGLHLDGADGNQHGIDYECNEEPKGEAAKFYRLLKEYQEPLTTNGRNDDDDDDDDWKEGALRSKLDVFSLIGRPLGQGVPLHLSFEECDQVHLYILVNCDELSDFVKEHKQMLEHENPRNVEQRHRMRFAKWIYDRVRSLHEKGSIDEDIYNLVCFPSRVVRRYAGYIVNGFRFHTDGRCENRKTQNSGVMVRGDDVSDKEYYGVLKDVFEVLYPSGNRAFGFKCVWFDVRHHGKGYKVDDHGLISVNKRYSLKTDEVYVLESQVEQVFYVQDPKNQEWNFVIKTQPRDLYDMPVKDMDQGVDVDASQQVDANQTKCDIFRHGNDDFVVDSLSTNTFMVEK